MTQGAQGSRITAGAAGCRVDIQIKSKGDVHVHACSCAGDKGPTTPPPCPNDGRPPSTEGACIPLGLGCKPKQSRAHKLDAAGVATGPTLQPVTSSALNPPT